MSRKIRIALILGACLALSFLALPLVALIPSIRLSEGFQAFLANLQNTYYWLMPLLFIIFLQPVVQDYTRRPDVHFTFRARDESELLVTMVNRGDTPFTFNRLQFFITKPRLSYSQWTFSIGKCVFSPKTPRFSLPERRVYEPKDGQLDVRYQGPDMVTFCESYVSTNLDASLSVRRGLPIGLLLSRESVESSLSDLRKEDPGIQVFLKAYFDTTDMKAESKQALPEDFIKSLASN